MAIVQYNDIKESSVDYIQYLDLYEMLNSCNDLSSEEKASILFGITIIEYLHKRYGRLVEVRDWVDTQIHLIKKGKQSIIEETER